MKPPKQPPESQLIEQHRKAMRPPKSVRKIVEDAGMSEARWRQIANGYQAVAKDIFVPVTAPAETLARMARAVGVTPSQLRDVDRADAADELTALLAARPVAQGPREQLEQLKDIRDRLTDTIAAIESTDQPSNVHQLHSIAPDVADRLVAFTGDDTVKPNEPTP